ncbi:MAG: dockerin type 1, partial [Chloroflexota bacterium]
TGGFIVAVGSSGMAQAASESSTQYSVLYNFDATQSAGTLVSIVTKDGQNVLTFAPAKDYQSVLFSSAELENGVTYNLYSGGSASGSSTDGLYADGAYTPGSTVTSFPISSLVTRLGAAGNTMGGGQGGRGGRPGGGGGNGMQPPG